MIGLVQVFQNLFEVIHHHTANIPGAAMCSISHMNQKDIQEHHI